MRTALLVIDMQQASFTSSPRYDAEGLVKRINDLTRRVHSAGGVVVFVHYDGPAGDSHHPMERGWQLLPALETEAADRRVRKSSCDAFLDTDLDHLLRSVGVGCLIVTGCATDFCVDATVKSALARRYRAVVPVDGHTTADRPYLPAQKIIEHHNAVWADFISPIGPATLAPCAEIEV